MAEATGVVGVFAHVDATVRAIHALRARGLRDFSVFMPVPVEEIEEVLERERPVSPVRLFTLVGGLTGTLTGFALTIWSSLKWSLVVGGKPVVSIPPFVIIAFELTILLGGLSTLLGLLVLGRLPRLRRSPHYDPRFSVDQFGIAVSCPAQMAEAARECLREAGAQEVRP
jgi:molybdopterin-containing oxidoreductase family membrane subunit